MSSTPPTFCVKLWKIDFFSKKTSTSSPPSPSKGGILNLFSSGSTLTPHDFNITVTAMSTSKQETVCEGGMVASEVKEVEGDGGMMCTELR
ncbi:hypothetical protein TrLO_g8827 [Triparma laevis f. longispina]|uniref:Uncharacterized protein n=1 Tax=Triparma laevis f. longispina TaxID=1714387 RepID=A0A9W7ADX3_9STRA|nr:hypothetical protein TrLO_g8827 [Triparma laevis f. longispina]